MENRLEMLRNKIDELVEHKQKETQRYFYVHLYAVSHFCSLLAIRRDLDPEIAATCGMLHDIYPLITGSYENHGVKGAKEARTILDETKLYDEKETEIIVNAISRHSRKEINHDPYDEILKDADVLHHCLYNPDFAIKENEENRYLRIMKEFGCENLFRRWEV